MSSPAPITVAFQGVHGANSEAAIHQHFGDAVETVPYDSFQDVFNVLPFTLSGCLIIWYLTLELNLLCTGDEFAFSRGVNVQQTKLLLFFAVSLMVGGAPLNEEFGKAVGADAYCRDAAVAAETAQALVMAKRAAAGVA